MQSESSGLNYWLTLGQAFNRGEMFQTKLKADVASNFKEDLYGSGTIGLNLLFLDYFFWWI